jgi:hypothetical protein
MPEEKAPSSGAFLPASLMYFCSGWPMHFCSGVDTDAGTDTLLLAYGFKVIDGIVGSGLAKATADRAFVSGRQVDAVWFLITDAGRACASCLTKLPRRTISGFWRISPSE